MRPLHSASKPVSSNQGDRLVEINLEHYRLDRQLSDLQKLGLKQASAILDRMFQLRAERKHILRG